MMTYLPKFFVVSLLLVAFGCTDAPSNVASPSAIKKVPSVKPDQVEPAQGKVEIENVFTYSPVGQRDPFESLLKKEQEARVSRVPMTPLEKFDLGQFRVQAILIGKGAPRAMVSAPDGKNYILQPGLKIGKNNGVIKDINKSAIIVEETTMDLAGMLTKGIQTLTIPVKKSF